MDQLIDNIMQFGLEQKDYLLTVLQQVSNEEQVVEEDRLYAFFDLTQQLYNQYKGSVLQMSDLDRFLLSHILQIQLQFDQLYVDFCIELEEAVENQMLYEGFNKSQVDVLCWLYDIKANSAVDVHEIICCRQQIVTILGRELQQLQAQHDTLRAEVQRAPFLEEAARKLNNIASSIKAKQEAWSVASATLQQELAREPDNRTNMVCNTQTQVQSGILSAEEQPREEAPAITKNMQEDLSPEIHLPYIQASVPASSKNHIHRSDVEALPELPQWRGPASTFGMNASVIEEIVQWPDIDKKSILNIPDDCFDSCSNPYRGASAGAATKDHDLLAQQKRASQQFVNQMDSLVASQSSPSPRRRVRSLYNAVCSSATDSCGRLAGDSCNDSYGDGPDSQLADFQEGNSIQEVVRVLEDNKREFQSYVRQLEKDSLFCNIELTKKQDIEFTLSDCTQQCKQPVKGLQSTETVIAEQNRYLNQKMSFIIIPQSAGAKECDSELYGDEGRTFMNKIVLEREDLINVREALR